MAEELNKKNNQDILLYNKCKIVITGISSVDSYDESIIVASTTDGEILTVEGQNITITDFSLDNKLLEAKGRFTAIFYEENKSEAKHGIIHRLFKVR